MSDPSVSSWKKRRLLSASEKYELWLSILTGQATQREAADRYGVDRSTVVSTCRTAKQGALDALAAAVPGRPGQSKQDAERAGDDRRARAAASHGDRAGGGAASARGKSALGLMTGPVPPRVDAHVKAGLLELVDHAVVRGWSPRRAAALLGLDEVRAGRWRQRRAVEGALALVDRRPGGTARHGLLGWERAAIVALFEGWAEVDRSHRKLAHRGSRLGVVHVWRVHRAPDTGRRRARRAWSTPP